MQDRLLRRIVELLSAQPWLTASQLAAAIDGKTVTRSDVNSILHRHRDDLFDKDDSHTPPRWALRKGAALGPVAQPGPAVPAARPASIATPAYAGPPLRDWQRAALDEWIAAGHRAIIESVTGSGKTLVGIAAAARAVDAGHRAVVVVSGTEEQHRWSRALQAALPGHRVAIAGLGKAAAADVLVGTAASVAAARFGQAGDTPTTVIVDDVHSYGPGTYAKALAEHHLWRLGLTSALERTDDLVDSVLIPYFGTIIPGCDYSRAVADGFLPKIRLVQVEVQLTDNEAGRLHKLEAEIEHVTDMLVGSYGAPDPHDNGFEPFVRSLAAGRYAAAQYAKKYFNAMAAHTALLAECQAKLDLVRAIPGVLPANCQAILFTDRAASAGQIARILEESGVRAVTSGAGAARPGRDAVAVGLREGTVRALVESRALDESLTVPAARLGVFLSSARSTRQMVQRMGRLIRPDADHPIVFLVAVVRGTPEDPGQGSAGAHLRQLWHIAERAAKTDETRAIDVLRRMLWPDEPAAATPTPSTAAVPNSSSTVPPAPSAAPVPLEPLPVAAPAMIADSVGVQQVSPPLSVPTTDSASTAPPIGAASAPDAGDSGLFDDLVGVLRTQGGIATADEIGDLIGLTDPDDMLAAVSTAADRGHLDFSPIEDGSGEVILLSADVGGTQAQRREAAAAVAEWAVHADDPINEFHNLIVRLGSLRVAPHRLIQIAAFLRGTTPAALL
ncbi:DEAD/DEAH box helicase [Nocardia cyriacigeorgica]|uniref:DEAD/DEAH box helicase n=1 Tax=Nocardia cyriacigeorgica TaxID=135487 RepID=UPI0002FAC60A|nr:DEAD/DEAH box helicase family protein [Nocardia cyriacigeorgica]